MSGHWYCEARFQVLSLPLCPLARLFSPATSVRIGGSLCSVYQSQFPGSGPVFAIVSSATSVRIGRSLGSPVYRVQAWFQVLFLPLRPLARLFSLASYVRVRCLLGHPVYLSPCSPRNRKNPRNRKMDSYVLFHSL